MWVWKEPLSLDANSFEGVCCEYFQREHFILNAQTSQQLCIISFLSLKTAFLEKTTYWKKIENSIGLIWQEKLGPLLAEWTLEISWQRECAIRWKSLI